MDSVPVTTFDQIPFVLQTHALRLVTALGVLLIGWLVALLFYGILRKVLQALRVDNFLNRVVLADGLATKVSAERVLSRGFFYLTMMVVFVAFFEALGLTVINDPLNTFFARIVAYLPKLIAPVVLLTVGFVVAATLKALVVKLTSNTRVNAAFTRWLALESEMQRSLTATLGNIVYWVVLLMFCLAVLDALDLQGLLQPLKEMLQKILGFLPNVLAALLILGVGWFLARVVQRIVSNLLQTMGADRLLEQVGLQQVLGRQSLAAFVGLVAYVVVLIPVLVASLNALKLDAITEPSILMLNKALTAVPSIVAAILVLFTAYLVGSVIARLISNLLAGAGVNAIVARLGVGRDPSDFTQLLSRLGVGDKPAEGRKTVSEIVGSLSLVAIMLFASIESLNLVGFTTVSALLRDFTTFAGQVILGIGIFAVGLFLSHVVCQAISSSGSPYARSLSGLARASVLTLSGAMALQQMGLARDIITLAFGILLGAIALAFAIAFGIGGRDVAAQILRDVVNQVRGPRRPTGLP